MAVEIQIRDILQALLPLLMLQLCVYIYIYIYIVLSLSLYIYIYIYIYYRPYRAPAWRPPRGIGSWSRPAGRWREGTHKGRHISEPNRTHEFSKSTETKRIEPKVRPGAGEKDGKEPVRFASVPDFSRQIIGLVRLVSVRKFVCFRFNAVRPAFFGRVVARAGLVPRPAPAGSRIKRFGSVQFGQFGSIRFLIPS